MGANLSTFRSCMYDRIKENEINQCDELLSVFFFLLKQDIVDLENVLIIRLYHLAVLSHRLEAILLTSLDTYEYCKRLSYPQASLLHKSDR